jgi:hypothetical protein
MYFGIILILIIYCLLSEKFEVLTVTLKRSLILVCYLTTL